MTAFDQVLNLMDDLSTDDKLALIERLKSSLEQQAVTPKKPYQSLLGLCADLGTAPTADAIDEVRREVWANFPREDF